jgi:predicted dehydrogenase
MILSSISNNVLPLAICGLGHFATQRILPAISVCQNVELVAVVDCSGKANCLPPNTRQFESLEHFLDTRPTGAVYISTPNYLHAQHSLQCLAAGLHVLCEKPMATNSYDCQSMVNAAQKLNLHLRVGHMLRYSPALQLARCWLQNGMIGGPRAICTVFHYDLPEKNRPWAFRQDFAGGGALMDAGIHCIDAIRFLLGDPVILLDAMTDRPAQSNSVESIAVCRFTAGGVKSFVQVCSRMPYRTRLSISGTDGLIVIDNFAACWGMVTVKLYGRHPGYVVHAVKDEMVDVSTTYSEQIRNFADAVGRSEANISESVDAAENVKIVEKLYAISHCL